MSTKQFDVALMRKGLEWAKEEATRQRDFHRDQLKKLEEHTWYQGTWASVIISKLSFGRISTNQHTGHEYIAINPMQCGSTCCFAGHVCVINGDDYAVYSPYGNPVYEGDDMSLEYVMDAKGEVHHIRTRAMELLGISDAEADYLFDGTNGIQTLERRCASVATCHGERL